MSVISERTKYVTGLPRGRGGSGDPSPFTAIGVLAAMRASAQRVWGSTSLKGKRVAVIGAGRVGSRVAKLVDKAGGKAVLADTDGSSDSPSQQLAGAKWTDPASALLAEAASAARCAPVVMPTCHSVE